MHYRYLLNGGHCQVWGQDRARGRDGAVMTSDPCARVRRWLVASEDSLAVPSVALSAHVAGCPHCRGALAALLARLLAQPSVGGASCDACADDLPAYAELERAQGAAVAARTYPQVWWHLWTCPDCAEGYENLARLLDAEAAGLIAAPPTLLAVRDLLPFPPIRLGRGFLHAVFGPQLRQGTSWHEGDDPLFLGEHDLHGCHVSIHVHQIDHEHLDLEITVEPPIEGRIVVTFGAAHYRAVLVNGRVAHVQAIPIALLADQAGPDLQIMIEREHGDYPHP